MAIEMSKVAVMPRAQSVGGHVYFSLFRFGTNKFLEQLLDELINDMILSPNIGVSAFAASYLRTDGAVVIVASDVPMELRSYSSWIDRSVQILCSKWPNSFTSNTQQQEMPQVISGEGKNIYCTLLFVDNVVNFDQLANDLIKYVARDPINAKYSKSNNYGAGHMLMLVTSWTAKELRDAREVIEGYVRELGLVYNVGKISYLYTNAIRM